MEIGLGQVAGLPVARLDWKHHAVAELSVASGGAAGTGQQDDASAAHFHAIQWYVTGNQAHALKAIEILNAWSYLLRTMGGSNARLQCGISGYHFCNAAEILKHTYTGWSAADQAQFKKMMTEVYYPVIEVWAPTFNGNWDAYMMETMMSIGIFADSAALFDKAVAWFLTGDTKGAVSRYIFESGQCQESTRDQMHVQMGLGALAGACETGFHQGLDLYGAYDNRLLLGFEYTAKYNLGYSVPAEGTLSTSGRGTFRPMWEIVRNHYVGRKGLAAPYTQQVVDKIRPEGYEQDYISLGTFLFHADDGPVAIAARGPGPPALLAFRDGSGIRLRYGVVWRGDVRFTFHDVLGRGLSEIAGRDRGPGLQEISLAPGDAPGLP